MFILSSLWTYIKYKVFILTELQLPRCFSQTKLLPFLLACDTLGVKKKGGGGDIVTTLWCQNSLCWFTWLEGMVQGFSMWTGLAGKLKDSLEGNCLNWWCRGESPYHFIHSLCHRPLWHLNNMILALTANEKPNETQLSKNCHGLWRPGQDMTGEWEVVKGLCNRAPRL